MSVIICPWCQSEIVQEEGEEPEKICPVCENELDGYRTLQFSIGDEEEEDEDEEEVERSISIDDDGDLSWLDEEELVPSEELERFEDALTELYDEQALTPECPLCREYMVEVGERLVAASEFAPRMRGVSDEALLSAPFKLVMYVCPSCFATSSVLSDEARQRFIRGLSRNDKENEA